ncbi:MAG TPA: M3 family metallopeptidase, partial [Deinococcales bacterium]|nr:M3 family metallopeptidase [Deinococcales bacterium]
MNNNESLPARRDVDQDYTWNLQSLFSDDRAYDEEYFSVSEELPHFQDMQGQLTATNLYDFLEDLYRLSGRLRRLGLYANLPTSADATDQQAKERSLRFMALSSKATSATAWLEPELLALGRATLSDYAEEDPRLEKYGRYFDRLENRREHVRTGEIENLLGNLADPFAGAMRSRGSLVSSDMPYPPVTLPDGSSATVAPSTVDGLLSSPDRDVRRQAFDSYSGTFLNYGNTLTDLYVTRVKQAVFAARARNYPSTIEEALSPREVPRAALETIVRVFKRRLPVWHRYWAVRRKLLGVDRLEPWDVFAPLSPKPP